MAFSLPSDIQNRGQKKLSGLATLAGTFVKGDLKNRQVELSLEKERAEKMFIRSTLGDLYGQLEGTKNPMDYNKRLDESSLKLLSYGGEKSATVAEELGKRRLRLPTTQPRARLLGAPEEIKDDEGNLIKRLYSFGDPGEEGPDDDVVTNLQAIDVSGDADIEGRQARGQAKKDLEEYRKGIAGAVAEEKELKNLYGGDAGVEKVLKSAIDHPQYSEFASSDPVNQQRILASLTGDVQRAFRVADKALKSRANKEKFSKLLQGKDFMYDEETGKLLPYRVKETSTGGDTSNNSRAALGTALSKKRGPMATTKPPASTKPNETGKVEEGDSEAITQADFDSAISQLIKSKGYTRQAAVEFLQKQGVTVK